MLSCLDYLRFKQNFYAGVGKFFTVESLRLTVRLLNKPESPGWHKATLQVSESFGLLHLLRLLLHFGIETFFVLNFLALLIQNLLVLDPPGELHKSIESLIPCKFVTVCQKSIVTLHVIHF